MAIDKLSALPDSLVIHVLSFLETKEAAITSVLSTRWQFLWTELPRLVFRERSRVPYKIHKFVARVHKTLLICGRNNFQRLEFEFEYNKLFACDVNVWIEFAVKSKVKVVLLSLNSVDDFHTLPQIMYSNPSLTYLALQGCIMAPRRTIQWQSLTELWIKKVQLRRHVIEKISSGCPVLRNLYLLQCWGFDCLEVNSQSIYRLEVSDPLYNVEPWLKISAPYVRWLVISLYPKGRKLDLASIPSLVRADIEFIGQDSHSKSVEVMSNAKEIFGKTQHVKELKLGSKLFEVLSMLAMNGWQLPQSRRSCLIVDTGSYKQHKIYGIVGLLQSSSNLETLIIQSYGSSKAEVSYIDQILGTNMYAMGGWGPLAKVDLNCDLMCLKTVRIRNYAKPNLGCDLMLLLARILLKRATILEEMMIMIDLEDTNDLVKIRQTLVTYPRTSQKAIVHFNGRQCGRVVPICQQCTCFALAPTLPIIVALVAFFYLFLC